MTNYKFFTSGLPQQEQEPRWQYHLRKLLTIKPIETLQNEQRDSELKKTLSAFDLIMLGIGGIIGTGIFVLTGEVAATKAGPAVVLSFVLSGIAASFAALSYSELASMIPAAGSAYVYSYATMGELMAWIIGWDLILEYLVGAATVAVGWSGYFVYFFGDAFNVQMSPSWTQSPLIFNTTTETFSHVPDAYFNFPAFAISLTITMLLILGIRESATVNSIMVSVKVFIVFLFIIVGAAHVDTKNYQPFIPQNRGSFSEFGVSGIFAGASVVFFAYIGFDAVSTASQEAKNPQRDLPIGIIGSLAICMMLYIGVCLVMTGIVPYAQLDSAAPIAVAARAMGLRWLGAILDLGALAGITGVILIMLMGQPRIFYSMAHDGLFPGFAAKIHPRFKTPYVTTAITGITCALAAAIFPIGILAELTSIGTLFAFFLVNMGVMILRFTAPDVPRRFRVPGGPFVVPIIGALLSLLLFATAPTTSIQRFFVWMLIGLIIYAFYGRRYSKVNNQLQRKAEEEERTEMREMNEFRESNISDGQTSNDDMGQLIRQREEKDNLTSI